MPYRQFYDCVNSNRRLLRSYGSVGDINASHDRRRLHRQMSRGRSRPTSYGLGLLWVANSPNATNGACGHGCAVRRQSTISTTGSPSGREPRLHQQSQPQHDFTLDGLTDCK